MIYKVTYPNAKAVRMHNANTRKFESVLKQAVKDGFIARWERTGPDEDPLPDTDVRMILHHPFTVENL